MSLNTDLPATVRPNPLQDPGLRSQVEDAVKGLQIENRLLVEQDAAIRALAGNELTQFRNGGIYGMGAATAPQGIMQRVISYFDAAGTHDANHFDAQRTAAVTARPTTGRGGR